MQALRLLHRALRREALGWLGPALSPSCSRHHLLAGYPLRAASSSVVDGMRRDGNYLYHTRPGLNLVHFSSSAAPEPNSKDSSNRSAGDQGDEKLKEETSKHSTSDDESELSFEDLLKLVAEKDALLQAKDEELKTMQDKVLRSFAEMENVVARTKRDAENSKKFALQSFAKSLLDVADNLGRAASVGKESLQKIESTETSSAEAIRRMKELHEGVEMTVKQLAEVFKKYGIEQFDPVGEPFDPNMHNAVVQMPDPSKPPGTVSAVLKTGYVLHGRIVRPAEVVVVSSPQEGEKENHAE